MNEQILSFIRTLVQSGASALAAKGLIDQQGETVLVAFIMWLIPTAWGLWVRRKAGLVASAAALPEVKQIDAVPAIARKVESDKVVAAVRG